MRLRQFAIVTADLERAIADLHAIFGLSVAHRDPGVEPYGLINAVLPAGEEFIELLQPTTDSTTAARFMARRGEAGYMALLQTHDAEADRARAARIGARVVEDLHLGNHRSVQIHPADAAGVLTSFEQVLVADQDAWPPAGENWRNQSSSMVSGIARAILAVPHPAEAAAQWARLTGGARSGDEISFAKGAVKFTPGEAGFCAVEIVVDDANQALRKAQARGVERSGAAMIGKFAFRPVAAQR